MKLIMENWRKFIKEQTPEEDSLGQSLPATAKSSLSSNPPKKKKMPDSKAGYPETLPLEDKKIKSILKDELLSIRDLANFFDGRKRPYKHSIVFASDRLYKYDGVIMNAEYMGPDPKWILGKNADNPYKDTHYGTTELITAVRAAIEEVHKTPDDVYSARLVKCFLGELDTKITEQHKKLAVIFQDLGWIPKKTESLYLEDFSVKPYFTDAFGNTYHGNPEAWWRNKSAGKGRIKGHGSHQTGMDVDLGFYMLPGHHMKNRFPPNIARGSFLETVDNANTLPNASLSRIFKKNAKVEFGAQAPTNTFGSAAGEPTKKARTNGSIFGSVKKGKFQLSKEFRQNLIIALRGKNRDPDVYEKGPGILSINLIRIDDLTQQDILDALIKDHELRSIENIEREAGETISTPPRSPREENLIKEVEAIKEVVMSLRATKLKKTGYKNKKTGLKPVTQELFITRMLGTIDAERTWKLIKGLSDNGASAYGSGIYIDEHLISVLKGACKRAGDTWPRGIIHQPNHRNHIHARIYSSKSISLGKSMTKKVKSTISQTGNIISKIIEMHKKDPKAVESFYEKQLKDIPAWRWSTDIFTVLGSGTRSFGETSFEALSDLGAFLEKHFPDLVSDKPSIVLDDPKQMPKR